MSLRKTYNSLKMTYFKIEGPWDVKIRNDGRRLKLNVIVF